MAHLLEICTVQTTFPKLMVALRTMTADLLQKQALMPHKADACCLLHQHIARMLPSWSMLCAQQVGLTMAKAPAVSAASPSPPSPHSHLHSASSHSHDDSVLRYSQLQGATPLIMGDAPIWPVAEVIANRRVSHDML